MPYNEADTRAKLVDPAIHRCGWTEDLIRREETAGTVEIINRKGRRRSRGRIDNDHRVKVNRPQTFQFFLPIGKPRCTHWAAISVRIVGPLREGHHDCGEVQAVVVYSEPMP